MISCNIWLPVVIHRSKTRNNALDVFWGIETIIMPLSRQPQKKSFCPVSHSLAPTFMKIFFIMSLPWDNKLALLNNYKHNIFSIMFFFNIYFKTVTFFTHFYIFLFQKCNYFLFLLKKFISKL